MKTRDIRPTLKEKGMEAGTLFVLEAMNERVEDAHKTLRECAKALDQMTDLITKYVVVAEGLNDKVAAMKRQMGEDRNELGPNTQGL